MDYNKVEYAFFKIFILGCFRYYKNKKNINTIVVYSYEIKHVSTKFNCNTINYDINAFYMSNFDGNSKL